MNLQRCRDEAALDLTMNNGSHDERFEQAHHQVEKAMAHAKTAMQHLRIAQAQVRHYNEKGAVIGASLEQQQQAQEELKQAKNQAKEANAKLEQAKSQLAAIAIQQVPEGIPPSLGKLQPQASYNNHSTKSPAGTAHVPSKRIRLNVAQTENMTEVNGVSVQNSKPEPQLSPPALHHQYQDSMTLPTPFFVKDHNDKLSSKRSHATMARQDQDKRSESECQPRSPFSSLLSPPPIVRHKHDYYHLSPPPPPPPPPPHTFHGHYYEGMPSPSFHGHCYYHHPMPIHHQQEPSYYMFPPRSPHAQRQRPPPSPIKSPKVHSPFRKKRPPLQPIPQHQNQKQQKRKLPDPAKASHSNLEAPRRGSCRTLIYEGVPDEDLSKFGGWPKGWKKKVYVRHNDKKQRKDAYWYTPNGKCLDSWVKVLQFFHTRKERHATLSKKPAKNAKLSMKQPSLSRVNSKDPQKNAPHTRILTYDGDPDEDGSHFGGWPKGWRKKIYQSKNKQKNSYWYSPNGTVYDSWLKVRASFRNGTTERISPMQEASPQQDTTEEQVTMTDSICEEIVENIGITVGALAEPRIDESPQQQNDSLGPKLSEQDYNLHGEPKSSEFFETVAIVVEGQSKSPTHPPETHIHSNNPGRAVSSRVNIQAEREKWGTIDSWLSDRIRNFLWKTQCQGRSCVGIDQVMNAAGYNRYRGSFVTVFEGLQHRGLIEHFICNGRRSDVFRLTEEGLKSAAILQGIPKQKERFR